MASYNPLIKPKANVSRNAFDLSQQHLFTAKPGMLLPVLSIDCVPNDYHEIDVLSLMKTLPVNTDAFVRAKQHFEFFFVPYRLMWSNWHNFISSNQAERTSAVIMPSSYLTPTFTLGDLMGAYNDHPADTVTNPLTNVDRMGLPSNLGALRLADLLGYGAYQPLREDPASLEFPSSIVQAYQSKYVNPFRIGAYNKIWYDYYRNKYYDNDPSYIYQWNFDDINQISSAAGIQSTDIRTYRGNNTDCLINGSPVISGSNRFAPLFDLHYRQWKKDLFTSLMPSQQFGAVSAVTMQAAVDGSVFGSNSALNEQTFDNAVGQDVNGRIYGNGVTSTGPADSRFFVHTTVNSQFDVYALLKAQMLQKWKETTLRAGVSAESQYRAHYGTSSRWIDYESCEFIGSVSSDIEINPIYSTAQTEGAPLGEIAGRGQSFSSGKTIKYKADDFGVLMCIYSILPEAMYDSTGVDKANTLSDPFEFFIPELQDLGLEAVDNSQLSIFMHPYPTPDAPLPSTFDQLFPATGIAGYAPRNTYLKTAVDKLHGEFMSVGDSIEKMFAGTPGSLASWSLNRSDMYHSGPRFSLRTFYVSPFCDQTIFAQIGNDEASDNFMVNASFQVRSVRPLSVLGLPQW